MIPELSFFPVADQVPVLQKVDSVIYLVNLYPLNSAIGFSSTYPVDSAIQLLSNQGKDIKRRKGQKLVSQVISQITRSWLDHSWYFPRIEGRKFLLTPYICNLGVPSPRRLYLERQFTRSVLLSWRPADLPANLVKGYGVYVNGDLRLMMNGGGKTKALLEDIDPEEVRLIVSCKLTLSQK